MFDVLERPNRSTLERRKEIKMKGLTLLYVSGNRPAYTEVRMLMSVATADMDPKLKMDPFKFSIKYRGIRIGNMPKAIP